MKLRFISLKILGAILMSGTMFHTAQAAKPAVSKYEAYVMPAASDEAARQKARSNLTAMPLKEVPAFVATVKPRLSRFDDQRDGVMASFEIIARRPDLDKPTATVLLSAIETAPRPPDRAGRAPLRASQEKMVLTFLRARTGALTEKQIDLELKTLGDTSVSATVRMSHLIALIEATEKLKYVPTAAQLDALLKNEDFEIRVLAVDWFRVAPPTKISERHDFLKAALQSKPSAVRDHAFRTIASWTPVEIAALSKISEIIPKDCQKEPAEDARRSCLEAQSKAKAP